MKRILTLIIALAAIGVSQAQGVQFLDATYDEVVKKAREENKFIFVDVYADWCKPCKRMDAEVFPNEELGKFMSENFVSYKANSKLSTGKLLRRKYGVDSYPHFLFIDYRGNLVYKVKGYMSAEKLMDEAKIAVDPSIYNKYEVLERKYNAGNRDKDLLAEYLELGYLRYKKVDDNVFDQYFKQLDLMDKQEEEILRRVAKYVPDADGRAYDMAKDYYLRIKEDTSDAAVQKIRDNLVRAVENSLQKNCEAGQSALLDDLLIKKEELLFEMRPLDTLKNIKEVEMSRLNFYTCSEDADAYREGSVRFVEAFLWDDERFHKDTTVEKSIAQIEKDMEDAAILAGIAEQYLAFYKEKEALFDAEEWLKQAIKWDDRLEYHGVLAKLTDALGDKSEAVNIARRALERARKENNDYAKDLEGVLMSLVEVKKGDGIRRQK